MNAALKKGFSFGLTSGIITTLGLIVGLNSSTHSQLVVMGGILVIAVADGFSDALGIHISEESDPANSQKDVWMATISTFIAKFFFALLFVVPVWFLPLAQAVWISVVGGLFMIALLSYFLARQQKSAPAGVILEHLVIAIFVIGVTHWVGEWVNTLG